MILEDVKPDIVCLSQTKLKNHILNTEIFDVSNYVVFRKDRNEQVAPGGGVAILVKKGVLASDSGVHFLNNHLYNESVWCELKFKKR